MIEDYLVCVNPICKVHPKVCASVQETLNHNSCRIIKFSEVYQNVIDDEPELEKLFKIDLNAHKYYIDEGIERIAKVFKECLVEISSLFHKYSMYNKLEMHKGIMTK